MDYANILIVEDDKPIAKIIKLILSQNGFSICDVVETGEEAVDIALRIRPDLILMDIKLQGNMDGIIACEIIRKSANIPFVYVTACGDQSTYNKAMATKPSGFIVKPFRSKRLLEEIETALTGRQ